MRSYILSEAGRRWKLGDPGGVWRLAPRWPSFHFISSISLLQLIDGDDDGSDGSEDDKSITPWMHYTIIGSYIHPTSLAACSTTHFARLPSLN